MKMRTRKVAHFNQTPNAVATIPGERRRVIISSAERETTQIAG